MKNKIAQKYFTQKKFSVVDIVCIAVAVVAAIVATFVWGGGPIGIPLLALSLMVLVFSRSTRVKDQEIDRIVQKMFSENCGELDEKKLIQTFYLSEEATVKGNDGKLRSSRYVVTHFETVSDETKITVYYFNILEQTVQKENFTVHKDSETSVNERVLTLASGRKKIHLLSAKDGSFDIPVTIDDVNSARILESICK